MIGKCWQLSFQWGSRKRGSLLVGVQQLVKRLGLRLDFGGQDGGGGCGCWGGGRVREEVEIYNGVHCRGEEEEEEKEEDLLSPKVSAEKR